MPYKPRWFEQMEKKMDYNEDLPPRPGEEKVKRQIQPPMETVPLYIQGVNLLLTESEALGVIGQLAGAMQTRKAGVVHNGQ